MDFGLKPKLNNSLFKKLNSKCIFLPFIAVPNKDQLRPKFLQEQINYWIHASDISMAEKIAAFRMYEIGWEILKEEEANHVNKGQYSPLSKAHEYYEQALIDKWVLVVHGYHAN